jgi:hypothetical protein
VLIRPLDHFGAHACGIVVGVGEEEHGRRDPERARLRSRIVEQPPIRKRLQSQLACLAGGARSRSLVRCGSDVQALPDRSRRAGGDDEPLPCLLETTPDRDAAAPHGRPTSGLQPQSLFVLALW